MRRVRDSPCKIEGICMAFAFSLRGTRLARSAHAVAEAGADGTRPTWKLYWSNIVPTDGTDAARVTNEISALSRFMAALGQAIAFPY
jgi:hypothetical protein